MVKQVARYTPESATTVKKSFYSNPQAPIKHKYDEVLASCTDGKITMQLRTLIQSQANSQHAAIDPPNHLAIEAKNEILCYRRLENIYWEMCRNQIADLTGKHSTKTGKYSVWCVKIISYRDWNATGCNFQMGLKLYHLWTKIYGRMERNSAGFIFACNFTTFTAIVSRLRRKGTYFFAQSKALPHSILQAKQITIWEWLYRDEAINKECCRRNKNYFCN